MRTFNTLSLIVLHNGADIPDITDIKKPVGNAVHVYPMFFEHSLDIQIVLTYMGLLHLEAFVIFGGDGCISSRFGDLQHLHLIVIGN